ncbi:pseudouridine synthase [Hyaloraphidium curvatum]|nr:pseudouridine synthase [Hyaloraphidium curvatum]
MSGESHRRDSYELWTHEELVARVRHLEAQIDARQSGRKESQPPREGARPFDFSRATYRPVALKLSYMGAGYYGFAGQEGDSVPTIESELFKALRKAKLVNEAVDRRDWNYSRCGRTDAGVSAFGQVVALRLRSRQLSGATADGAAAVAEDCSAGLATELPYASILNNLLPPEIRILAWSPATDSFSARFDCRARRYRYYFPRLPHYDLEAMREAAQMLVGTHDFRNFCKVDPAKPIQSFTRTILRTAILENLGQAEHVEGSSELLLPSFAAFEVVGTSFLWHQVRCLVAVLLLVAEGKEPPSVVSDLLDMSKQPLDRSGRVKGRPMYAMAPEAPLVLAECTFDDGVLDWRYHDDAGDPAVAGKSRTVLGRSIYESWNNVATKELLLRQLALAIGGTVPRGPFEPWAYVWAGRHKRLMEREREPPVEDRLKPIANAQLSK